MEHHLKKYWAWDDCTSNENSYSKKNRSFHEKTEKFDAEDNLDYDTNFLDDRNYSSSDDSPVRTYRYSKYRRYNPYVPVHGAGGRERRYACGVLAKFFLFCTAMILFCVLMYIPVYNRANDRIPKGMVAGWTVHTNRDTRIYVQPNNVTLIHEPNDVCPKSAKKSLFLLIVVCSSTTNFEYRAAIRKTWADYENYIKMSKLFRKVQQTYKNYNYTHDLYPIPTSLNERIMDHILNMTGQSVNRTKRSISFGSLLPELAEALKNNMDNVKTEVNGQEEKRFDDDSDDLMLPEFNMNKELGEENNNIDYDYQYETNVMKIPPNGYQDTPSLGKILSMIKNQNPFADESKEENMVKEDEEDIPEFPPKEPMFKLVFLLGLPSENNDTVLQGKIEEEIEQYGDIIQEGFVDSYNNLTLKSIMMLKWVVHHCNDSSVRYILKTDDDMFINIPNLITTLKNKSKEFDKIRKSERDKEYLLIGDLICGARPVSDSHNKWYSPRYMYGGRVYPRYLSGTGYVMSLHTAKALYYAALRTPYFHLEDIYITGMSAARARPRVTARDDPGFSYQMPRNMDACSVYSHVTSHRVPHRAMVPLVGDLTDHRTVDICEKIRLTQIRRDRLRPKVAPKRLKTLVRGHH